MNIDIDDYCGICKNETNYETCYCCTLCWKLICENCIVIFEKYELYTVCKNNKCITVNKILNKLFNKDVALRIALFCPNKN